MRGDRLPWIAWITVTIAALLLWRVALWQPATPPISATGSVFSVPYQATTNALMSRMLTPYPSETATPTTTPGPVPTLTTAWLDRIPFCDPSMAGGTLCQPMPPPVPTATAYPSCDRPMGPVCLWPTTPAETRGDEETR